MSHAWDPPTDTELAVDKPASSSKMKRMRDLAQAMAEGATGAPSIVLAAMDVDSVNASKIVDLSVGSAELAASAVPQSKLSTAQGEVSTTSTGTNLTLPGGEYGFYLQIKETGDGINAQIAANNYQAGTSYLTSVFIGRASSGTVYAQQRYIQASPPYDLGDGEIPLFVFAVVDNATSNIISVYSAPEAPWHYNGKTNITADYYVSGKPYFFRNQVLIDGIPKTDIKNPARRRAIISRLKNNGRVLSPVSQSIKNADMVDIPHPFTGNDLTGQTVIMLDPVCECVNDLYEISAAGQSINELLHEGYISIGSSALNRVTPSGVMVVAASWK